MSIRYIDFMLDPGARKPSKRYSTDAGWDLYVSKECIVPAEGTADVHTGLHVNIPVGVYGRITGRSSSMRVHGLLVNEGIIDSGYTGEMFVCVRNLTKEDVKVRSGSRIAQILFHRVEDVRWSEVSEMQVDSGKRGDNGFGSTGE